MDRFSPRVQYLIGWLLISVSALVIAAPDLLG
jgi:hypothetical protein